MLNLQPLHRGTINQVGLDDFVDVGFVYVGVPGTFRVDHADRTFLAAVQASCLVDANFSGAGQFQFFGLFLCIFTQFGRPTLVTVCLLYTSDAADDLLQV